MGRIWMLHIIVCPHHHHSRRVNSCGCPERINPKIIANRAEWIEKEKNSRDGDDLDLPLFAEGAMMGRSKKIHHSEPPRADTMLAKIERGFIRVLKRNGYMCVRRHEVSIWQLGAWLRHRKEGKERMKSDVSFLDWVPPGTAKGKGEVLPLLLGWGEFRGEMIPSLSLLPSKDLRCDRSMACSISIRGQERGEKERWWNFSPLPYELRREINPTSAVESFHLIFETTAEGVLTKKRIVCFGEFHRRSWGENVSHVWNLVLHST